MFSSTCTFKVWRIMASWDYFRGFGGSGLEISRGQGFRCGLELRGRSEAVGTRF